MPVRCIQETHSDEVETDENTGERRKLTKYNQVSARMMVADAEALCMLL